MQIVAAAGRYQVYIYVVYVLDEWMLFIPSVIVVGPGAGVAFKLEIV